LAFGSLAAASSAFAAYACSPFAGDETAREAEGGSAVDVGMPPIDGTVDAPGDGPPGVTPEPGACVPGSAFGPPRQVTVGVATYAIESARVAADGTHAVLAAGPENGGPAAMELFAARRIDVDRFDVEQPFVGNAAAAYDAHGMIVPPAGRVVFASARGGVGLQMYGAPGLLVASGPPAPYTLPPGVDYASGPFVTPDASALYFAGATVDGGSRLRRALHRPGMDFDVPNAVAVVGVDASVNSQERAPVVTADEREIFYASNGDGASPTTIWSAVRTGAMAPGTFGGKARVDALAVGGFSYPTWVSPDGCELYFVRKETNEGPGLLFVAVRAR